MRVQLIRPPLDDWYKVGQFKELISVPAGLCLLASSLRNVADVEVRDGMYRQKEESLAEVGNADIVGVSVLYSNARTALEYLRTAKERGATTIIGGPYVNEFLAKRFLDQCDYIDYVVVGRGEEALAKLVKGDDPKTIPNLTYRKDGAIISNKRRTPQLTTLFDLENLVDWQNFNPENYFPVASMTGCLKREKSKPCSFCSITDRMRFMNPKLAWKQKGLLNGMYGVDKFWEIGDDFTIEEYLERTLDARPEHLAGIKQRVYACAERITPKILKLLKELNTVEIFVGLESANDNLLRRAGKSHTTKDVVKALNLIEDIGFFPEGGGLHLPFMLGLPGETSKTVRRTVDFAKYVVKRFPTARVIASHVLPLPGTELFENLINNPEAREEYPGELERDVVFDYQALVRLQNKFSTYVTFEQVLEAREEIKDLLGDGSRVTSFDVN